MTPSIAALIAAVRKALLTAKKVCAARIRFLAQKLRQHIDLTLFAAAVLVFGIGIFMWSGKRVTFENSRDVITFTQWWEAELPGGALETLAAEFEALHPGVDIRLDTRPYRELRALLYESAPSGSSGQLGDVVGIESEWAFPLLERGVIEGEPLPLVTSAIFFFYNIDVLKAAGFAKPPKTRDEFLDMIRVTQQKTPGLTGLALSARGDTLSLLREDFYPWFYAGGKNFLNGLKPAFAGAGAYAGTTLSFFKGMIDRGFAAPVDDKIGRFAEGEAVFMSAPSAVLRVLEARMPAGSFGISSIPVPAGYTGKPVFAASVWSAGVRSAGPHREDAAAFAAFLAERSAFLAGQAGAAPGAVDSASPEEALPQDPLYEKARDLCTLAGFAQEYAGLLEGAALEQALSEELDALLAGTQNVPAAAKNIQTRWEGILESKSAGAAAAGADSLQVVPVAADHVPVPVP
ncbi:MAG: ABC transporter substrate-binding protein [Treponema sp.]|jgi:multiple sugar transport system substrate-binding protein|nr:ABC transporter substrate-binding protein [Treponema sp.]